MEASTLPLSIFITGSGKADFDSMEELDSDNVQLTAPSGRKAARDIVQFVAMREVHSTLELTREVNESSRCLTCHVILVFSQNSRDYLISFLNR